MTIKQLAESTGASVSTVRRALEEMPNVIRFTPAGRGNPAERFYLTSQVAIENTSLAAAPVANVAPLTVSSTSETASSTRAAELRARFR